MHKDKKIYRRRNLDLISQEILNQLWRLKLFTVFINQKEKEKKPEEVFRKNKENISVEEKKLKNNKD